LSAFYTNTAGLKPGFDNKNPALSDTPERAFGEQISAPIPRIRGRYRGCVGAAPVAGLLQRT
jgi:hypothetical protein